MHPKEKGGRAIDYWVHMRSKREMSSKACSFIEKKSLRSATDTWDMPKNLLEPK